jgi:hypothetical protein
MDGVFVAYHNTARIFGFQYISLDEMDERLFGNAARGDRVFEKCIGLLEMIADEIANVFPKTVILLTYLSDASVLTSAVCSPYDVRLTPKKGKAYYVFLSSRHTGR